MAVKFGKYTLDFDTSLDYSFSRDNNEIYIWDNDIEMRHCVLSINTVGNIEINVIGSIKFKLFNDNVIKFTIEEGI